MSMAVPVLTKLALQVPSNFGEMLTSVSGVLNFLLIHYCACCAALIVTSAIYHFVKCDLGSVPITKLQVAVADPQRQLQHQLEKMAAKAYNSAQDSRRLFILQETAALLLGSRGSFVAAHLAVDVEWNSLTAHTAFTRKLAEERAWRAAKKAVPPVKEGLKAPKMQGSGQDQQQLTVVTLLVAGRGLQPLYEQLTEYNLFTMLWNLHYVLNPNRIMCYQVLWTPEGEAGTYSSADLAVDYPQMEHL